MSMKVPFLSTILVILGLNLTSCTVNNINSRSEAPDSQPSTVSVEQIASTPTVFSIPSSNPPAVQATSQNPQEVSVFSVAEGEPRGLKIASARITYNDGDTLTGNFRIYCPTQMIRPTNYILKSIDGLTEKQGDWWEPAFTPKWESERLLIRSVCG